MDGISTSMVLVPLSVAAAAGRIRRSREAVRGRGGSHRRLQGRRGGGERRLAGERRAEAHNIPVL